MKKFRLQQKNFLFILISFFIFIIFLELILFFLPVSDAPNLQNVNSKNDKLHYKKDTFYNFSKGSLFSVVSKKKTNNYGYFDNIDFKKNSEAIMVIGDSYVAAMELNNDETFHHIIKKKLNTNNQVYSIGVISDQLPQYLYNAMWSIKEFKSKTVIFSICYNDFETSFKKNIKTPGKHYFYFKEELENENFQFDFIPYKTSIFKKILRNSNIAKYLLINVQLHNYFYLVRNFISQNIKVESNQKRNDQIMKDGKLAVDIFMNQINKIKKKDDIKFIFILDAPRPEIYKNVNYSDDKYFILQQYLKKHLINSKIEFIDLEAVFKYHYEKERKNFEFEIDFHWNSLGHEIIANELIKIIK